MGETLDHALNSFFGAVGVAGHTIADLHNGAPVLRREILVGRLVCEQATVSTLSPHNLPTTPPQEELQEGNLLMASS